MSLIQEENFVIIRKHEVAKAFQVKKNRQYWFDRQTLYLDGAIGQPFGTVFEIRGKHLLPVPDGWKVLTRSLTDASSGVAEAKDNRNLVDDGTSQQLTKDDIESLKGQGKSGKEIVDHLIANSTTFSEKNEYSQVKYKQKKNKKYSNYLVLLKPCTRLLVEMYYSQGPQKIQNMRMDSLAQILTMANVRSGGKYIVLESCLGLLAGAVLERLGSEGSLTHVYTEEMPQNQAFNMFNFSESARKLLFNIKFKDVVDMDENSVLENDGKANLCTNTENSSEDQEDKRMVRRMQRLQERREALALLRTNDADGLIIATQHSPLEPFIFLMKFLSLSRPFAVFSPYKEPLAECYTKLKNSGQATNVWLTETWLRGYQVLPNRTHPYINMSGGGGYLLTGLTVEPNKS